MVSGDELSILCATVERLLAENLDHARIAAAENGPFDAGLWGLVEAAGLTRVHLPEAAGGAGYGWREAGAVLRLAGRHAVPLPLAETMVAGWALSEAGFEAAIPAGPMALAPCRDPDGGDLPGAGHALPPANAPGTATLATPADVLALRAVPWARHAAALVAVISPGDADGLSHSGAGSRARASFSPEHDIGLEHMARIALVGPASSPEGSAGSAASAVPWRMTRLASNLAGEARDDLALPRSTVLRLGPHPVDLAGVWTRLALARSAQLVGALEAALDLALRYAGERVQFGRPIGRFQAVQQELARFASQVAAAGAALEAALAAADRSDHDERERVASRGDAGGDGAERDTRLPEIAAVGACAIELGQIRARLAAAFDALSPADPTFEIAVAKIVASDAASAGAAIAHQVHGAIGFTAEHPLQHLTRRLWSWRAEAGRASDWAGQIGDATLQAGPEALWPRLTAR